MPTTGQASYIVHMEHENVHYCYKWSSEVADTTLSKSPMLDWLTLLPALA